jgi:hypothetical protein
MATDPTVVGRGRTPATRDRPRRLTTETKAAWKTTEFWVFLILAAGVLIASHVITGDNNPPGQSADPFTSDQAWLYVTILGVGYMVARGLAKSGSRDPYWDRSEDRD